ncbi:unnamed protein product [Withania somnifera]
MEYDFRNRTGPSYDTQVPMYGRPATTAPQPHPMYGQSQGLYPRPGQNPGPRNPPFYQTSSSSSSTSIVNTSGRRHSRSTFNFDFDLEKKILAEAEKETQNWSRLGLENLPSRMPEQTNTGYTGDPLMKKYATSGFNREAVALAVANYGDNPIKVKEFVEGYTLLKEMGFSSNSVADALLMNDNDKDKAAAHLLGNSL